MRIEDRRFPRTTPPAPRLRARPGFFGTTTLTPHQPATPGRTAPLARMAAGALLTLLLLLPAPAPAQEPITPIPAAQGLDPAKLRLGETLFRDPRLSANGNVSCLTCHQFNRGGADGQQLSQGTDGKPMAVNTPTIFNNGLNFLQGWAGQPVDLRDFIGGVLRGTMGFGEGWSGIASRLSTDTALTAAAAKTYPDGLAPANIADAIAVYVQSLNTPNGRFDRFLAGDTQALTAEEREGYALFKNYGCVSCHQGVNVGGNLVQALGIVGERGAYFGGAHAPTGELGRFRLSGDDADRFVFRVPSLRNVALTAPYLHDGSAPTLGDAVTVMFRYQLGLEATQRDTGLIVDFLETLNGEIPPSPAASGAGTSAGTGTAE